MYLRASTKTSSSSLAGHSHSTLPPLLVTMETSSTSSCIVQHNLIYYAWTCIYDKISLVGGRERGRGREREREKEREKEREGERERERERENT